MSKSVPVKVLELKLFKKVPTQANLMYMQNYIMIYWEFFEEFIIKVLRLYKKKNLLMVYHVF